MKTACKSRKNQNIVAEICLYGNHQIGAGWLARLENGELLGDGEPRQGRCFTSAVWLAADEVRKHVSQSGYAWVYAAGGRMRAKIEIAHVGYFGNLPWESAAPLEISSEAIEAAAGV